MCTEDTGIDETRYWSYIDGNFMLSQKGDECGVPDMDIDPTITRAALPYSSGTTGMNFV